MRPSKPPAFQFYAKEWIADTREFPPDIRGALADLMAFCWVNGSVPDVATSVATLVGVPLQRILDHWTGLRSKFGILPDRPGRMFYLRLEVEREKQEEKRAKASVAGVASAEARARKRVHERFNVRSTDVTTNDSTDGQRGVNSASAVAVAVEESTSAPPPQPLRERLDFEAVYAKYPRRKGDPGKKRGLDACRRKIKTAEDYTRLLAAVERYAVERRADVGTPYIPMFSTWMNDWTDFEGAEFGPKPSPVPKPVEKQPALAIGYVGAADTPEGRRKQLDEWKAQGMAEAAEVQSKANGKGS